VRPITEMWESIRRLFFEQKPDVWAYAILPGAISLRHWVSSFQPELLPSAGGHSPKPRGLHNSHSLPVTDQRKRLSRYVGRFVTTLTFTKKPSFLPAHFFFFPFPSCPPPQGYGTFVHPMATQGGAWTMVASGPAGAMVVPILSA